MAMAASGRRAWSGSTSTRSACPSATPTRRARCREPSRAATASAVVSDQHEGPPCEGWADLRQVERAEVATVSALRTEPGLDSAGIELDAFARQVTDAEGHERLLLADEAPPLPQGSTGRGRPRRHRSQPFRRPACRRYGSPPWRRAPPRTRARAPPPRARCGARTRAGRDRSRPRTSRPSPHSQPEREKPAAASCSAGCGSLGARTRTRRPWWDSTRPPPWPCHPRARGATRTRAPLRAEPRRHRPHGRSSSSTRPLQRPFRRGALHGAVCRRRRA